MVKEIRKWKQLMFHLFLKNPKTMAILTVIFFLFLASILIVGIRSDVSWNKEDGLKWDMKNLDDKIGAAKR